MKAVALLSGGLDSILASRIIKDLGIELTAFNTLSPFCLCTRRSSSGCYHGAASAAKQLGLRFLSKDVSLEFLEIVKAPKHGYGSNVNPCIDCRILLFKNAKEVMQKEGAAFIITGEVLGQRPMSQRRVTMRLIEEESGLQGLVVRPLSAKILPETTPEKLGWISREKLLSISGRSRRSQLDLAKQFGINDYPCPSGGCLLTDPEFSRKVRDLISHNELVLRNVKLLRVGRHFRLSSNAKLIVGRNEEENGRISTFAEKGDYVFTLGDVAGPNALGTGLFSQKLIALACSIVARYCDSMRDNGVEVACSPLMESKSGYIKSYPAKEECITKLRI